MYILVLIKLQKNTYKFLTKDYIKKVVVHSETVLWILSFLKSEFVWENYDCSKLR